MDETRTMGAPAAELRAAQKQYLFPCVSTYYAEPLVLTRGAGVRVEDADGREYLDLFAGILTTSVGHCHPEVVEATARQMRSLGHTSSLYVTESQIEVARRLAEITPGDLRKCFFSNSGTEAVETAIMLACMHTGSTEVLALRLSYSGRSVLATNLTAHAPWRPLNSTLPIKHVPAPYPYRCPYRTPCDDSCVDAFTRELEEIIATTTTGRPACLIAETILGVGGYIVPHPGYFQRAAQIVRAHGGLFICDEVQAGFGRTGERWFGIEHWDVVPDIMVMAKGIANGQPVGATVTTDAIAASWTAKTISTFGGNPVSMAAAAATLDVLRREDAPSNAALRGAELRVALDRLADRYEWIGEARGMGLMQAIEMVTDGDSKTPDADRARRLLETTREEGILVGLGGLHGHVLRLGPSLLITEAEIAEGIECLERACERVERGD